MKTSIVSLIVIAAATASTLARAENRAPAPVHDTPAPAGANDGQDGTSKTVHRHDGFFLGVQLPLGFQQSAMDTSTMSGFSSGLNLLAGGAVHRDVIVYGELSVAMVSNPKLENDVNSAELENVNVADRGVGAGALYYIMPWNVYVGGSLLLSTFNLQVVDSEGDELAETESDLGIGAAARVGKEFWVSDNWALGVGLQARFATMKFLDEQMTTGTYGLTLNGTYN